MTYVDKKLLTVPAPLRVKDQFGDLQSVLYPLEYLLLVAQATSALVTQSTVTQNTINNHNTRIAALEAETTTPYSLPLMSPGCLGEGLTALDALLTLLVADHCLIKAVTGQASDLVSAIGAQCVQNNNSAFAGGTLGGLNGWVNSPTKVSDTIKNIWLTLCDLRNGLLTVNARTSVSCSDVIINYGSTVTNNGKSLNIYLAGYANIPAGFSDTPSGSTITVTDSIGNIYTNEINVTLGSETSGPIAFDLSASSLFFGSNYNINLNSNISNGSITCQKNTFQKAINNTNSCPGINSIVPSTTTIAVVFQPYLTTGVNYQIVLYAANGTTVLQTQVVVSPATSFTTTFTGLSSSTIYQIGVQTMYVKSEPTICPLFTVQTASS